jgi:pimeloyl-ACP methyl ester carboxylesterase
MTRLHFLDPNPSGTPAVFLLHGLGANNTSWTLQFEPLIAAGMRPVAPDLPGFGKSAYDGRGWSFKRIAQELADLQVELQTGPVHVIGLSMGGVAAQQFALDYPERIRKLMLVSTFCVLRPENLSQWGYFAQRLALVHLVGLKQQARVVARRVFPNPEQEALRQMAEEQIASADPRAYRAALRALGLFDSRKRLRGLDLPVLVVTGADDSTVSPARQKLLAITMRGAEQVVIPQAGHAVAIDQFEAFNRIMLAFLRQGGTE